jgi:metal-responsive CopG/Arc/MetJ family transcriptional regulator
MKTAISLPDDIFEEATQRAQQLGMSRSEFFTHAARRYLAELTGQSLTAQIDQALQAAGEDGAGSVAAAPGRRRLAGESEW